MSMFWASRQNHGIGTEDPIGAIPGLVSHWSFDNITGATVHDETGSNDGTISGATIEPGYIGSAAEFTSSVDYVDCGLGPWNFIRNTLDFTISMWLKPSTSARGAFIGSTLTAIERGFWIEINGSGELRISIMKAVSGTPLFDLTTTGAGVAPSSWFHFAATAAGPGGLFKFYINGVEVGSATLPAVSSGADTRSLHIGRGNYSSNVVDYVGQIDQVRIYNAGLSAAQVALLAAET